MAAIPAIQAVAQAAAAVRCKVAPSSSLPLRTSSTSQLSSSFAGLSLSTASPSQKRFQSTAAPRPVVTMGMEAGVGALGNKVGMLTWFTEDGQAVPCTVIGFHEGNVVTQIKSADTDGYSAVQVGYRRVRQGRLSKPEAGHLKAAGTVPLRHLQEFRLPSATVASYSVGQQLNLEELFKEGDLVDISGTSIGKGFAGGIKRHNFARGQRTHGSKSYRQLGSIGAGTTPGRVYPGKKMPGQLGNETVKIRKLKVVKVDPELHAVIVKGSVPGKVGNLLRIAPAKIVGKNIPAKE